ncbi:MAG TPA: hypothetical protein VHL81_12125 [Gemmatimonadales bacterium]|jgi:hypothetical protein|nr:hypothetical protein [Gemmatimonadales bacterium]
MRLDVRQCPTISFAVLAAACGGGDLTLPGDSTPAVLSIIAGDGQTATEGSPVADPLVVQLEDGAGRPVAGGQVEFRFVGELPGSAITPGTAPTDASGQAAVHARLGQQEGAQVIEALVAVPGEDLRVHFQLTALAEHTGSGDPPGEPGTPPPAGGGDDSGGADGGGGHGGGHGDGGHGDGGHGHGKGSHKGGGHGHD